jgi:hypothetical protein
VLRLHAAFSAGFPDGIITDDVDAAAQALIVGEWFDGLGHFLIPLQFYIEGGGACIDYTPGWNNSSGWLPNGRSTDPVI